MHSVKTENLTFDSLPDFCTMPLRMAKAQKITVDEGQIIIQSIEHFVGKIQLIDFCLRANLHIDFPLTEASFFLSADLYRNSCFISYRPPEQYHKIVTAGKHRILLIHFKSDWFVQKCLKLPDLKNFVSNLAYRPEVPVTLPAYGIAERVFNQLKKADAKTCFQNQDKDFFLFINNCVNKYHNKLVSRHITSLHHQHQAIAIAKFIAENYASDVVEDLPGLAAKFMVSERHLARIARMTFGIPLHSQVIKIRLHSGLYQLMTTDKPVHEISRTIGYREPYYFSKAFKKHFGIPPGGWKNSKILPSD
ncbi:helix-turn-helix transcriptional regulator [Pedobacter sp. GR22-6]|uniref:helix-turn-helix transcriptional regulator n=1 Tax=Pedobacter sp. GR22-6 TaxID=3127957 RepID=UPI00307D81D0